MLCCDVLCCAVLCVECSSCSSSDTFEYKHEHFKFKFAHTWCWHMCRCRRRHQLAGALESRFQVLFTRAVPPTHTHTHTQTTALTPLPLHLIYSVNIIPNLMFSSHLISSPTVYVLYSMNIYCTLLSSGILSVHCVHALCIYPFKLLRAILYQNTVCTRINFQALY